MKRGSRAQLKHHRGAPGKTPSTSLSDAFRRGLEAARSGNHAAAIVHYRQTIALQPAHAEAHDFLGSSLREQGDCPAAIASYERALALKPRDMHVRVHLAEAQRRLGLHREAVANCDAAIGAGVRGADAYLVRALARKELGDLAGAIADLQSSARISATPDTLKTLARALMEAGDKRTAAAHLNEAARIDTKDFETFRLLGDCLSAIGEMHDAFAAYRTSIDLNPKDAFTYANFTGMLCFTGQLDLAIATGKIATQLAPNMSGAHFNLAMAYETQLSYRDAVASYAQALRCKPDLGVALLSMCRLLRYECEWDGLDSAERLAQTLTYKKGMSASPFSLLPMAANPKDLLECNSLWAASMAENRSAPLATYAPRPEAHRQRRIRIGYLSADFQTHATAALISELFELHDRTTFETFGYSIGNRDEGEMRQRIVGALDHFVDLNALSHSAAATRIHADEIDILIDLKGYTSQARPQIVAHRPAPIQVNYLGYPSTMGAHFVDYIIADDVVAPHDHAPYFREDIVHLPNSYQPNDRKRKIGAYIPTRAQCGLPEDGFVFCCFNANYKLSGAMFDIWMRLLQKTPNAVLWLLASNDRAPDNLRREAAARGVSPDRLVFAPRLPVEDHLARVGLGDLFLDTLPIGAHTTASEALWTGLPVLTCLGEAFPGRVGASLLHAIGMPDMVRADLADYEAEALRLAHDPEAMAALRARLRAARDVEPLFDTLRYTRNYEAALVWMMERRDQGLPPAPFTIEETAEIKPTP